MHGDTWPFIETATGDYEPLCQRDSDRVDRAHRRLRGFADAATISVLGEIIIVASIAAGALLGTSDPSRALAPLAIAAVCAWGIVAVVRDSRTVRAVGRPGVRAARGEHRPRRESARTARCSNLRSDR